MVPKKISTRNAKFTRAFLVSFYLYLLQRCTSRVQDDVGIPTILIVAVAYIIIYYCSLFNLSDVSARRKCGMSGASPPPSLPPCRTRVGTPPGWAYNGIRGPESYLKNRILVLFFGYIYE